MAVPKKKLTRTRSRQRRSHQALKTSWGAFCSQCKFPIRPHTVCPVCGYYKNKPIIDKKPKIKKK